MKAINDAAAMTQCILDSGESCDVTDKVANDLTHKGLIYRCDDHEDGAVFYHLALGVTWEQIEQEMLS